MNDDGLTSQKLLKEKNDMMQCHISKMMLTTKIPSEIKNFALSDPAIV